MAHTNSAADIYGELAHQPRVRGQALLGLARIAMGKKDYAGAIRLASDAAKAGAGANAWMLRGVAYLRTGEATKAGADFDRVLAKEPRNDDAREAKRKAEELEKGSGNQ